MGPSVKIGITGLPKTGKSETIVRVLEMLKPDGYTWGGLQTVPIFEEGVLMRVNLRNFLTGEEKEYGVRDAESRNRVENIGLDLDVMEEFGVPILLHAIENCDIIIIDEVGKMEVESLGFREMVEEALDSEKTVILTLHKKSRNALLQDIRRRDDVRILEVTLVNRNLLPYKIVRLIKGEIL